jgi:uncharacterized protein CbrC (UPF0167 family)
VADALPSFKYQPDPSAVFQPTSRPCQSCGVTRGLEYIGAQYGLEELDHLCAFCIADGSAAARFDLEFVNSDGAEPGPDAAKLDELLHRTPGYDGPEGDPWPVHCDDYCAHLGRASWRDIEAQIADLEPDVEAFCEDMGFGRDEFRAEVERPASPLLAHLFRCLTCGKHRLVAAYE